MEVREFRSSAIRKAGYDAQSGTLTIWFTGERKRSYDYHGVPAHMWQELLSAWSVDRYFRLCIESQFATQ